MKEWGGQNMYVVKLSNPFALFYVNSTTSYANAK